MSAPNSNEKKWQRTNKQKKFLKKPQNKTAKKHYFKELEQNFGDWRGDSAEKLVKNDLETFAKILEFADSSKELDVNILRPLLEAASIGARFETDEEAVKTFFNLTRQNIHVILFQMLIALKKKVLTNNKKLEIGLLMSIFHFFNTFLGYKRVQKLLRNTEGFETISQPDFWAPIYFSPKLATGLYGKIFALQFSLQISRQKSFTEKFVEDYVALAKMFISEFQGDKILQSISQIILESEQGEYFLKLVSDLPQKSDLIASQGDEMDFCGVLGPVRALVKCANCGVLEESEKQFQKCSRCGIVFYCSKACQRNDWQNHKEICKEIRKQN